MRLGGQLLAAGHWWESAEWAGDGLEDGYTVQAQTPPRPIIGQALENPQSKAILARCGLSTTCAWAEHRQSLVACVVSNFGVVVVVFDDSMRLQTDYFAFADGELPLVGRIEVVIHNARHSRAQRTGGETKPERGAVQTAT